MTAPTGAQTTLSYSAAPPAVCTVDSSTGALTLEGVGSCEIMATAAGTDDYNEATVTHTVTVHRAPTDQDDALTTILDMDTESIVTPTAITQTAGDTLPGYDYAVDNLIDGRGLSATPTVDNLDSVTSVTWTLALWVTGATGGPHYFSNSNNPNPQFTLTLDQEYDLSALVVWGFQGSASEATDFTVEFSTDGGGSYHATETVQTSALLGTAGAATAARLDFTQPRRATHVRLTITSNAYVRGFSTTGGDRVGMAEIRFVAEEPAVRASNGMLTLLQGVAGTIDLSALAAGDMLTYALAAQPANGTVSVTGSVATYTPNAGYFGADSFTYTVTGSHGATATGTITVIVNRLPVAQDGALVTQSGVAAEIDVSLLASDPDNDTLSFRVDRQPAHGSALLPLQTGGNIVYTPESGYAGSDSFTYTADDGAGGVATGTITVTVEGVTLAITSGAAFPAKDAFTVTLTFSGAVTGLVLGEIEVTDGTGTSLTGAGMTYTLTVTPDSDYHGDVTVSVAAGAVQTVQGFPNASASKAFPVDTKGPALRIPSLSGAVVTLTFDEDLDESSVPTASAFTVTVGGSAVSLASSNPVAVSGTEVTLVLAAVAPDATVQASYTAPDSGSKLQDVLGNEVADFASRKVFSRRASSIRAGDLVIAVSAAGRITGLTEGGDDYLAPGYNPALLKLIVADTPSAAARTAEQLLPIFAGFSEESGEPNRRSYLFSYDHGINASVRLAGHAEYASLELVSIDNPMGKDIRVAMWGPYEVTIGEQVADVVGVAYSRDFAIGIQAANEKTFGGAPFEFTDSQKMSAFDRSDQVVDAQPGTGIGGTRVALNKYWRSAARLTTFGSVLQAYSRDYTADRFMKVASIEGLGEPRVVKAVPIQHALYSKARLQGSKVALFGVKRRGLEGGGLNRRQVFKREILEVIRQVALGEGLPYTTGNGGVWNKFAEDSKHRIMQMRNPLDGGQVADDILQSGISSIYLWHYTGSDGVFKYCGLTCEIANTYGTLSGLNQIVAQIHGKGMRWGNHALPGFAYMSSDGAIATRAADLTELARTVIHDQVSATQTEGIVLSNRGQFTRGHFKRYQLPLYSSTDRYAYAQIGDEIIRYSGTREVAGGLELTGVTRGFVRTTARNYAADTVIRALLTFGGFNALAWGDDVVLESAEGFARGINGTSMNFTSIDGVESYDLGTRGEFTMNAYYKALSDGLESKEFASEGSRLSQYLWHFHNRYMWGEKNAKLFRGTDRFQRANSVLYERNFLPNHLGGYFLSQLGQDEIHYLGSKVAALDAGILIRGETASNIAAKATERGVLKHWIEATEAGAFSDFQRARMMPWLALARLDAIRTGREWRLWNVANMPVTQDDNNDVTALSFGNNGDPFRVARPWAGFPTRNIAADAIVTTSSKKDAGFQGDNAVDGHTGIDKTVFSGSRRQRDVSEWAVDSEDNERWIQLTWDSPVKVRAVMLSDRGSPDHNVTGGTLSFSSGDPVTVSALDQRGKYDKVFWLPDRETTFMKFTITGAAGTAGLAEIVVIGPDSEFKGDLTAQAAVVGRASLTDAARLFDGVIDSADSNNLVDAGSGVQSLVIDLGDDNYWVDGLNVWRQAGLQYNDVVYQLSTTRDFSSDVTTVFGTDSDNTLGQGVHYDWSWQETARGMPVMFSPVRARYVRLWSNGSGSGDTSNKYVEVEVYGVKSVAGGITPTTDGASHPGSVIDGATDGAYASSGSVWTVGDGKKYAQIDLGRSRWMDSLRVWHNYSDIRRYRDVIFQLSDDATFGSGVTTVFNNDLDNSSGLGAGTDGEYDETVTGKIVHFAPVRVRYVRLYSNGNTKNRGNHYVEIMVGQSSKSRDLERGATSAPRLQSVVVYGNTLTLTYDEDLDTGSVPAAIDFAVTVNGTEASLADTDAVRVSGRTVTVTLVSAVTAEQVVTVSYTVPATSPIRGTSGNGNDVAASLMDRAVDNETIVVVEPVVEQVITPTVIAQTRGNSRTDYDFHIDNLIDGSGLSDTPTTSNLDTVTHDSGSTANYWLTQTQGSPSYFADSRDLPVPQFTLTLDKRYSLSSLVIWGAGGNTNDASDFTVEFSTDGGNSYSTATETVQTSGLVGNDHARLSFGQTHEANFVRLTITNNAKGRGFPGSGGDRVGLGEIRFVGSAVASNAPPVAMAGSLVTLLNTAGTLVLSTLASDAEGGTLSYAVTQPSNGSVSRTGAVVTYTPNTDHHGTDSFNYTVTDDANATATATVSVTVHRAPTARDASVTTPANTALTYDLSPLAFDPDGDTLEWSVGVATNGTVGLQYVTGGSVIYTPDDGYVGIDSFTYTVTDGHVATATGTITVAVGAALLLNLNAIATGDTVNIAEKAAGFTISGDTGSEGGVTVTVTVGTTPLTATSTAANPATWLVSVPGDAPYISEPSVAVEVNASKTGYAAARAVQSTLAVDLTAPTAPTYTAPGSLQVGVAIAAVSPSGGSDINEYSATGLARGAAHRHHDGRDQRHAGHRRRQHRQCDGDGVGRRRQHRHGVDRVSAGGQGGPDAERVPIQL